MCFDMFCLNANDSFKCVSGFFFYLCVPFLLRYLVSAWCVHRQCVTFERMTQWRRSCLPIFFIFFFLKKFILLCLWQFIHLSTGSWLSHLMRLVRFINKKKHCSIAYIHLIKWQFVFFFFIFEGFCCEAPVIVM